MTVDLIDIYHLAVNKLNDKGFEPKPGGYVNIDFNEGKKEYIVDIPVTAGDNDQIISVSYNEIAKYRELKSNSTICNSIW
jgi:hypothetical protein